MININKKDFKNTEELQHRIDYINILLDTCDFKIKEICLNRNPCFAYGSMSKKELDELLIVKKYLLRFKKRLI